MAYVKHLNYRVPLCTIPTVRSAFTVVIYLMILSVTLILLDNKDMPLVHQQIKFKTVLNISGTQNCSTHLSKCLTLPEKEQPIFVSHKHLRTQKNMSKVINSSTLLDVILQFPFLTDPVVYRTPSYARFSLQQLEKRLLEYMTSLQLTLIHEHVSTVHFLYDHPPIIKYIQKRIRWNLAKLSFHRVKDSKITKAAYEFAFSHLSGRLVMITQADVYPDDGFDLIRKNIMVSQQLMYALSRYEDREKHCARSPQSPSKQYCSDDGYMGSHDAYIFVPTGKIPPAASNSLSHRSTDYGTDNVIIWTFIKFLNYTVLNPCKVIYTYHFHCIDIRNADRTRINTAGNTGYAMPTNKLFY